MNPKLLEIVACPKCQGRLKYDKEHNQLVCNFDHVAYPVEQGVPVLLAERAVSIFEKDEKK